MNDRGCKLTRSATIREVWLQASSFLAAHGVDEALFHAELLLRHELKMERATYLAAFVDRMPASSMLAYEQMIIRRAAGEPTQYIIGSTDFYGLSFHVTSQVLIPRPETELLVEAIIIEATHLWGRSAQLQVADIGTGSGAIACTLAHLCPQWHVMASDISAAALIVAQSNAEQIGVAERLSWQQGDLLLPFMEQQIDIVVSNLPYIPTDHMAGLMREVRDYEPYLALDGGTDGLALYQRLIAMLLQLETKPRLVGFEVGAGQAEEIATLLRATKYWISIRFVTDLAGIKRHVIGVRGSDSSLL